MPKQIRYAIKQKLQGAINELQKAADKLTEVGSLYEKDHPEYYDAYCGLITGVSQIKEAVQNMSDQT